MSSLFSPHRQYEVKIQDDGNLVIYTASGRVVWASGADPSPDPVPPAPVVPPPTDTWPRLGASYYTSLTDPRIDPPTFAVRLADLGVTLTRAWLFDAWAIGASAGTGCYDGYLPWVRGADGRFDLWSMDAAYLDRLRAYVEAMAAQGILVQLCGCELYTWSDRKQGLLWVPPSARQPWRCNSQGVDYHDDHAFERIGQPMGRDAFLGACYQRVVATLDGLPYSVELGNELPEKTLHARLAVAWRDAGYRGSISVNRQEDTPGQYRNMRIGQMGGYDRIAFHGKRSLAYLDEEFPREPELRTFQLFWASGPDPSRVILSSDGCRASTDVARLSYSW
ncbi:MAG TPA: hypothetical protein PLN93_11195 [Vicinamibacterales bacterium]|nr:hypothetical protein [Vicinamibacterales bacterium]HPK72495.1 hypothetical protein [Vicinamibacterales bacterium]